MATQDSAERNQFGAYALKRGLGMIAPMNWLRHYLAVSNISANRLAGMADTSRQQISKLINRPTLNPEWAERLAPLLHVTPAELTFGPAGAGGQPQPPLLPESYRPPPLFFGERDLPVFSAVEGGPGELVISTDAIDYVPRPWYLGQVREGYAVVVVGESMVPAFEPGDMAIVNPRLPPLRNKHHILVQDGENGDFRATIKRVLGWTDSAWKLEQYNPPPGRDRRFSLPRQEWVKALRVVGKYEGQ